MILVLAIERRASRRHTGKLRNLLLFTLVSWLFAGWMDLRWTFSIRAENRTTVAIRHTVRMDSGPE